MLAEEEALAHFDQENIRIVVLSERGHLALTILKPDEKAFTPCGTRSGYLNTGYSIDLEKGEWTVCYGIHSEDALTRMAKIGSGRAITREEGCSNVVMVIDITSTVHIEALANYAARIQRAEFTEAVRFFVDDTPFRDHEPEKLSHVT